MANRTVGKYDWSHENGIHGPENANSVTFRGRPSAIASLSGYSQTSYNDRTGFHMSIRSSNFLAALLVLVVPPAPAGADEGMQDDGVERCIDSRSIRRTDVVNDDNIVFYMRGSKIYLNTLTRTCGGLAREGRFSYVTHTRSLCRLDAINILRDSGFGIYEGKVCKLGRFELVTEQDLTAMFDRPRELPDKEPLEPSEVEDVLSDDAEN